MMCREWELRAACMVSEGRLLVCPPVVGGGGGGAGNRDLQRGNKTALVIRSALAQAGSLGPQGGFPHLMQ